MTSFNRTLFIALATASLSAAGCSDRGSQGDAADGTDTGGDQSSSSEDGPSSDGPNTTADPDESTGTTGADESGESTGTTGEGFDDPGCPECMVLADGLINGRGIAVDLEHVVFTDQNGGTVHRVRKGGGDGGLVAEGQVDPYDVAVSDGVVYWTNYASDGAVMRAPLEGGMATELAESTSPRSIAVVGSDVYWGTFAGATGDVMHVPADGSGSPTALANTFGGVADLVVDGTDVYFTSHTELSGGGFIEDPGGPPVGSVLHTSLGGDPFAYELLADGLAEPWGIAKQGDALVWVDGMGRAGNQPLSVLSMSSGGGAVQSLASGQTAPWGVAVDEQYAYWTDHDTVRAVPLEGGDEIVLAELQNQARSIVVDEQWVFWITRDRVLQRPKP